MRGSLARSGRRATFPAPLNRGDDEPRILMADFGRDPHRSTGLVDVLDRVADQGLPIAGDIRVSLAEVELLTIRIRLLVCSIDKAEQIGLDWWRYDSHLAPAQKASGEAER